MISRSECTTAAANGRPIGSRVAPTAARWNLVDVTPAGELIHDSKVPAALNIRACGDDRPAATRPACPGPCGCGQLRGETGVSALTGGSNPLQPAQGHYGASRGTKLCCTVPLTTPMTLNLPMVRAPDGHAQAGHRPPEAVLTGVGCLAYQHARSRVPAGIYGIWPRMVHARARARPFSPCGSQTIRGSFGS